MNRFLKSIFSIAYFVIGALHSAPSHVVTFFLQDYPSGEHETLQSTGDPLYSFKTEFNKGIFVTYFGYKTASDSNGQVSFPRKHQDPNFSLLICLSPTPIFMLHNTISHWEVEENASAAFYSISRQQDEKTKLYFWSVEEKTIPKDRIIPLNTIIIHAHPYGIDVPLGITITSSSDQFVLPTIYTKSTIETSKNALAFLQTSDFFGSIDRVFKLNAK